MPTTPVVHSASSTASQRPRTLRKGHVLPADDASQYQPTLIGSAQLALSLLFGEEHASALLESMDVTVMAYTLDTNIILQDLSRYLRTQKPTGLMIAARLGGVRLFASTTVREEVSKRLGRVVVRRGIDLEHARRTWQNDYVPWITFLDPSNMRVLGQRALSVEAVDADDLATAQLIDAIKADAVLTEDHHLAAYEPTGHEWTKFAVAARDKSRRDANYIVMHFGGGITVWLGSRALGAVVSLVLKANKGVLLGVGLVFMVAAGGLIAHPASRGWLREKTQELLDGEPKRLWGNLSFIGETLVRLAEQDQQAKLARGFIAQKRLPHDSPRHVRDYIPAILSRSHAPLTVAEITRQMVRLGYKPKGKHPERYVARVLRANPTWFEMQLPRRWGLRSHLTD